MHLKYLQYLVDPVTKEPLSFEGTVPDDNIILNGFLLGTNSIYPVIDGVPRFVKMKNYAESFGWQWSKWPRLQFDSENIGKPMDGHTGRMWHAVNGLQDSGNQEVSGELVLDIGCGPGRFIEVARRKGHMVIGVDYSLAVNVAQQNFRADPDVCIIQADALQLPFSDGVFDAAFSIGVLHHTPDPAWAVGEAHRVIKRGGRLAVAVYNKGKYYYRKNVQAWRWLFCKMWPVFGSKPPLLYAYMTILFFRPIEKYSNTLGYYIKKIFPFINLPDRNWSILDTFDSVTPSYQSGHEPSEVASWFMDAGFDDVTNTRWSATAFSGKKKPHVDRSVYLKPSQEPQIHLQDERHSSPVS